MQPSPSEFYDHLGRNGQRLTRTRRAVIDALFAARGPASVRELHAASPGVDLVTVYRALHWLVELKLVREVVTATGGERYELVDGAHTHHLHCSGCGRLFTVPVCGIPASLFDAILREYGFAVDDHRVTFHGRCCQCRGAAA